MRPATPLNSNAKLGRRALHTVDPQKEYETSPFVSFGEVSKSVLGSICCGKQPIHEIGMVHANENLTSSGAAKTADKPVGAIPARRESAIQTAKRPSGRGGARNSAVRENHALTAAQVANLIAGERYAAKIGLPFTRMITIHWERAGVALEDMVMATGRFVDLLSKTVRRHGGDPAWLWVHEGGFNRGWHCHLLAHVPVAIVKRITRLQRKWLRAITGRPYRKGVIHSKPIGGRLGLEHTNRARLDVNLETVVGYLVKQAQPEAASEHCLNRVQEGGRIIRKRCATSQNIGAKARKKEE